MVVHTPSHTMDTTAYAFAYQPPSIHHAPGVVGELEPVLDANGLSRALLVTGSTVSTVSAVMDPVEAGLGEALVETFTGTTPGKYLRTAYEGARRVREVDADVVVGLGGGSSLDLAKLIAVLAGHDRPLDDVVDEIVEREAMLVPEGDLPAVVAIPTTLPGADISQVAGVKLSLDPEGTPRGEIPSGGVSDARVMPTAVFHDPELVATTPTRVLATSAMNGYDKAIEMLYTRNRTPITDATAMRGLRLLQANLPAVAAAPPDEAALSRVLQGLALAQYGVSTPDAYRASIIHAFGHALSRTYDVQQGAAHGIAAPHVLRYLFDRVDARRDLLAEGLGVADAARDDEATAAAVVDAVAATRDALDLPTELRTVDGAARDDVPALARAVLDDSFMAAAPPDLDPTPAEIEGVFEAMW